LRFDAIHQIADDSGLHIIDEIAAVVRQRLSHRNVHLIAENEDNQAYRLPRENGQPVSLTAQWNDDVHHVLHVAVTGETNGYYAAYGDARKLARALAEGFAFQGEWMAYRERERGESCVHLPPAAFVSFIQNHDQIGNRALGERLVSITTHEAIRAITAVYLLLPQVPMLFMGEEWGETQPFLFFCDFYGELAEAVRNGRRIEFQRFPEFVDPVQRERIPDPNNLNTFLNSRLNWADTDQPRQRATIDWYKTIIAARQRIIIPRIPHIPHAGSFETMPSGALKIKWCVLDKEWLILIANLNPRAAEFEPTPMGEVIWQEGECRGEALSPWFVQWSLVHLAV
jgi:maltooligosyltrehalose trehalohydrolase